MARRRRRHAIHYAMRQLLSALIMRDERCAMLRATMRLRARVIYARKEMVRQATSEMRGAI